MPRLAMCLLALLAATGCEKAIGDDCTTDTECGQGRICDRASRGGYCTVSPCARDTCPADSVCVEFETDESFCMATCGSSDDCRTGYTCDEETGAAAFCRQAP
ncbi:MAG: hypothetical protein H6702_00305 [Myxococcales bacterium]|nr:hypothetical protein [Myxococcales bacterium]